MTEGTDAQATVSVRLEENGRTVTGKASDTDTMAAAAYAYVNALNKLLVKREKQAPEALTVAQMRQLRPRRAPPGPVYQVVAFAGLSMAFGQVSRLREAG